MWKLTQRLITYTQLTPNKVAIFHSSMRSPYATLCFKLQPNQRCKYCSLTLPVRDMSLTTGIGLKALQTFNTSWMIYSWKKLITSGNTIFFRTFHHLLRACLSQLCIDLCNLGDLESLWLNANVSHGYNLEKHCRVCILGENITAKAFKNVSMV